MCAHIHMYMRIHKFVYIYKILRSYLIKGCIANKLTYRSTPKKKVRIGTLEMTWKTDICGKGIKIPHEARYLIAEDNVFY